MSKQAHIKGIPLRPQKDIDFDEQANKKVNKMVCRLFYFVLLLS